MTNRINHRVRMGASGIVLLLAACAVQPAVPQTGTAQGQGRGPAIGSASQAAGAQRRGGGNGGPASVAGTAMPEIAVPQPGIAPTAPERAGLLLMREEEKLARDAYQALYERWQAPVFSNIARSEQTHMDSVKQLLDAYGIADPAAGKPAGSFTNPRLQALYTDLVTQGSTSIEAALRAGATIEDMDIADLKQQLAATADASIAAVYNRLKAGSENHLRSFAGQLERNGASYAPRHLAQAEYDAIVKVQTQRGPRWSR